MFRNDDGARVCGETEEDVYAAPGLSWIAPTGREDPAEIDKYALIPAPVTVEV